MKKIESLQNPKIKEIIKLRKAKRREKSGLIVIEGKKEVSLALAGGIKIKEIYFCKSYINGKDTKNKEAEIIEVTREIFDKISLRENPDGLIALARPKEISLEDIKLNNNALVVVLESVEKPGNLGAILRSADAAQADAVVVCDKKTDIYNPNVIRASLGTVFTSQIAVASFEKIIKWLKNNKIKSFATTPDTDKIYTDTDFRGRSAIVIGTEHDGLSEKWIKAADERIKIPMKGKIDSLNASVSAGVILFEALRQRGRK